MRLTRGLALATVMATAVLVAGGVAVVTTAPRARAVVPGQNGLIAFTTDRDGNFEIYTMTADGSNPTNLTKDAAIDSGPAWSPDGSQIAFTSNRDGNSEVYVMDANGSHPTNLTNNAGFDEDAAWSPDGTKIAFVSTRDGETEIYTMNAPTDRTRRASRTTRPRPTSATSRGPLTARRSPTTPMKTATSRSSWSWPPEGARPS